MKKLSANEVKQRLDRGENFHLINVLSEDHYREKRIPGSVNVPLAADSFLQRVGRMVGDKSASVVVYCAGEGCNASPKAAQELERAGFEDVGDFEGGVKEWEQAGYRLEGDAVEA